MRVVVTVEQLWQRVPGGSGEYIRELVENLPGADVQVQGLAARAPRGAGPEVHLAAPVARSRLPRPVLYESWNRTRRPHAEAIAPGPVDVVHATTWAAPGHRAPLVVTVHDLAFLRDPSHFTARGNRFFHRSLDVVRAEATRVVVPSSATRKDCLAAGIDADRVTVVPHGVKADLVATEEVVRWRQRRALPRPYVLWCGTLEPRKNVPRLVAAFVRARAEGLPLDLVLVGPTGWGDAAGQVERQLGALPAGSVHRLGRIDAQELQLAYAGAAVFAYPSLWEGFGMPVLEAMAHGVPVVTSLGTSMAEFAVGAGALVDPLDVDSIADGLLRAVGPAAADLGAHGRQVAAMMTWAAAAQAHAAVYAEALAAG